MAIIKSLRASGSAHDRRRRTAATRAKKQIAPRLFVSFWSVGLENLPQGEFLHRALPPKRAKQLIDAARAAAALSGVSSDDLLAPGREREKESHAKLCRALRKRDGIELSLKDFLGKNRDHEGRSRDVINPLQLVEVGGPNRLLVVDCHFVARDRQNPQRSDFAISPDSIRFHLFESFEPSPSG